MTIAIYGSRRQGEYLTRIVRMLSQLHEHGINIIMHSKLYRHLKSEVPGVLPVDSVIGDESFEADAAISLGGDGTFLRTARWIAPRPTPIVGVNTGHLGYLAAYNINEIEEMVEQLLEGDFDVCHRTLLSVTDKDGKPLDSYPYALNEVAILKAEDASMINCNMTIGSASPACYQADGVIISTPTGSTGYNLSVGGYYRRTYCQCVDHITHRGHSLTMRPLVVGDNNVISIETTCRAQFYRVSLDGNSVTLPAGQTIIIAKAPFETLIIQRKGHSFIDTLRNKLKWGV